MTYTLISRLPDCTTAGRNSMLWPWRSFLRLDLSAEGLGAANREVLIKIVMLEAERRRNCLIIRAGRATRSLPKKNDKQYDQQNEA
jgi:hypothetical protein